MRVLATAFMSLAARRTRSKRIKRIRRAALAFFRLLPLSPIERKTISIYNCISFIIKSISVNISITYDDYEDINLIKHIAKEFTKAFSNIDSTVASECYLYTKKYAYCYLPNM